MFKTFHNNSPLPPRRPAHFSAIPIPSARARAHRLFIDKKIIGPPKQRVNQHNHHPNQQRNQNVQSNICQEQKQKSQQRQHNNYVQVIDSSSQHDNGLVAEEVEEEPRDHRGEEDDHRDGVPEEAEEEDEEEDYGVVHGEVDGVGADSEVGFADGRGEGEGAEVDELAPRAAGGEGGAAAGLGAGDEVQRGGFAGGCWDRAVCCHVDLNCKD